MDFLLGKLTRVAPVGMVPSMVLGLVLMPGIYFPVAAWVSKHDDGLSRLNMLGVPSMYVVSLIFSALVLAFAGFLSTWDSNGRDTGTISLIFTALLLHVLVTFFVVVVGNILIPRDDDE